MAGGFLSASLTHCSGYQASIRTNLEASLGFLRAMWTKWWTLQKAVRRSRSESMPVVALLAALGKDCSKSSATITSASTALQAYHQGTLTRLQTSWQICARL